ncbi:hypothetical protein BJ912DRAFT_1068888 [Pholiota molesta]|nr:hypothetical protein BJ912DRAFT_1068888 [Pholiota molesta]
MIPTNAASLDWIRSEVFSDAELPVPFDEHCLDNVTECWTSRCRSSPTTRQCDGESRSGLAQPPCAHTGSQTPTYPERAARGADFHAEEPISTHEEPVFIHEEERKLKATEATVPSSAVSTLRKASSTMVIATYLKGPSGAYRFRKPDIILVNRNLRHFLQKAQLRPRWHHIDAIVEVSSSAPRESMLTQILEKASLMFETQPFRRFAIGLAFRGNAQQLDYPPSALPASFCPSYAKPELLGVDTTMAIDLLSGNVTKVKVQDREFDVDGQYHILKDAWLLVDHGISEITVLSDINSVLRRIPVTMLRRTIDACSVIVGEELGDSTDARRGKLTPNPLAVSPSGSDWSCWGSVNVVSLSRRVYQGSPGRVKSPLAGLEENIPVVGTIIDYDYARRTNTLLDKTSVRTLPFMPVAALDPKNTGNYTHGPAQDLESLFHVALGVMTFTNGPCGAPRQPTDHVPIARWYNEIDREQLFKDKTFDLMFFDTEVANHITDYWKPLAPYLRRLFSAIWPTLPQLSAPFLGEESHQACKDILEEALNASKALNEAPAKYAPPPLPPPLAATPAA